MRNRHVILTLEALRDRHASEALRRAGSELTTRDTKIVWEGYLQWVLLLSDLGYLPLETRTSDVGRIFSDLSKADIMDVLGAMNDGVQLVRQRSVKGFKALCRSISCNAFAILREDIRKLGAGDVFAARRLLQVFSYLGRLSLIDIDLTSQCESDYKLIEENMSPEPNRHIVERLRPILSRWVKGFDFSDLRFRHGPGGVAGHGRCTLETKYRDLTDDPLTRYSFGDYLSREGLDSLDATRSHLDRISHTIFVPKSYKTFRTISMEPTTLQFLQQGIWRAIDSSVQRSAYLRSRIGFRDQSRNQRLAQAGSLLRNYCTIDLSSASDSVSYSLVKQLFRGTPLLRYLVSTRSHTTVLPSGELLKLKKYAPMGSALCFPIETLIFASVCEYVTRVNGHRGQFSVFGDDIIVPTDSYDDVVRMLNGLGFIVNSEKSYYKSECWFRESCGGEYINGIDVTPLRISRSFSNGNTMEYATGYYDLANSCQDRGFKLLRAYFLQRGKKTGYIPIFAPNKVESASPTNYHTRSRWNPNLHRTEFWGTTEKSVTSPGREDIRYLHWLRMADGRPFVLEAFESRVGYSTVAFRKRYLPTYDNMFWSSLRYIYLR